MQILAVNKNTNNDSNFVDTGEFTDFLCDKKYTAARQDFYTSQSMGECHRAYQMSVLGFLLDRIGGSCWATAQPNLPKPINATALLVATRLLYCSNFLDEKMQDLVTAYPLVKRSSPTNFHASIKSLSICHSSSSVSEI